MVDAENITQINVQENNSQMTKFLILDNAYNDAFNALPHANHDEWFQQCFGTSNFLDIALRAAGHEAKTLVRNFFSSHDEMAGEGRDFEPDVVLSREAGRFSGAWCRAKFPNAKLVCTCSHAVDDAALAGFDAVFTSFPWFVDHLKSIGVRCEYLPLAFGRPVLDRIGPLPAERDIPVCFIGGLGPRIWKQGTETMAAIAEAVPEFRWWGYYAANSLSDLPASLQAAYQGQCWGIDMYRTLARTKICLNRHGEIAGRGGKLWANNCRTFEGPGVGCYLLSDCDGAFSCNVYSSAEEAISKIRLVLDSWDNGGAFFAETSQQTILEKHCFEHRVPRMLEVIESP